MTHAKKCQKKKFRTFLPQLPLSIWHLLKKMISILSGVAFVSSLVFTGPIYASGNSGSNDKGTESEDSSPGRRKAHVLSYHYNGQDIKVEIPYSSQEDLKRNSPESIAREFKERKERGIFSEVNRKFVPESIAFFFALGLIQSMNLVTNYASNPMALDEHINSLSDPITHISFYTFMLAQTAVSPHLLRAIMTEKYQDVREIPGKSGKTHLEFSNLQKVPNPKLVHFVPYLSMTFGMMVSQLTAGLLAPLQACVGDLMKKDRPTTDAFGNPIAAPESCSKAYEDFVLSHLIIDMVPSLISMLASTYVSGYLQQKLVQAAARDGSKTLAKRILWKGADIITSLTPQGLIGKLTVKAILHVGQITLFLGLDHVIMPFLLEPWYDFTRGWRLDNIENELLAKIQEVQANNWVDNCREKRTRPVGRAARAVKSKTYCDRNLKNLLNDFNKKMAEWRELNLSSVRIAQSGWESKTKSMFDSYFGAKEFYTAFIDQANAIPSKLDEFIPLYGILSETEYFRNSTIDYHQRPNDFIFVFSQFSFLAGLREFVLNDPGFSMANLNGKQKEEFQSLLKQFELKEKEASFLNSNATFKIIDIYKIWNWHHPESQALYYKYASLLKELDRRINQNFQNSELKKHYQMLKDRIGEHQPRMVPGEHFLSTLGMEKLKVNNRYQFTGVNGSDYLILQMICGPDSRDTNEIFSTTWGFEDSFNAPRIIDDSIAAQVRPFFCDHTIRNNVPKKYIYQQEFNIQNPQSNKRINYKGALDLIRNNFSTQIFGNNTFTHFNNLDYIQQKASFDSWWDNKLLNPLSEKVQSYQDQYSTIIKDFIGLMKFDEFYTRGEDYKRIWNTSNLGPISNNPMVSILQEHRLYATLLGEIIANATNYELLLEDPRGQKASKQITLKSLWDMKLRTLPPYHVGGQVEFSSPISFLQSLAFNPAADLNTLLKSASDLNYLKSSLPARQFDFQMRLEKLMNRYVRYFNGIKAEPIYGRVLRPDGSKEELTKPEGENNKILFYKIIHTNTMNQKDISKELENEIESLRILFLYREDTQSGQIIRAELSVEPEHQELIAFLLSKIENLNLNSQNYAQIISAINFGDGKAKPEDLVPVEPPKRPGLFGR